MANNELKPCPFCGSDNIILNPYGDESVYFCENCQAEGPAGIVPEAQRLWNNRYQDVRHAPCENSCEAQSFYIQIKNKDKRIQELEAHVERLRDAIGKAKDWNWLDADRKMLEDIYYETPAQSLQAVKDDAVDDLFPGHKELRRLMTIVGVAGPASDEELGFNWTRYLKRVFAVANK
jgi:hypothetical protein